MMTIPHVLVGAALGSLIGEVPGAPVVAFGVGWASHYVLDSVPHWERLYRPHDEIDFETSTPAADWPKHIFVQAALDVILAGIILYLVASNFGNGSIFVSKIIWGGIGGVVPDILGNVPFWNRKLRRLQPFRKEYDFHSTVHITPLSQQRMPKLLGLLTQVVASGASLLVLGWSW